MRGAGHEIRTRDLNLGKVALYQLSYSRAEPRSIGRKSAFAARRLQKTRVNAAEHPQQPRAQPGQH